LRSLRRLAITAGFIAFGLGACSSTPEPGEIGKLRFAGRVLGSPPLRLLPPYADPQGTVYTLYGALDFKEVVVHRTKYGGGEQSLCAGATKGDRYGAHGWVGFAVPERAWYWSGDALVAVSGNTCGLVLDRDPSTNVNLMFRAVLPWVRDAPSRDSIVAFVQSPVDPTPFSVMVDLDRNFMSNVRAFEPADAREVQTIGVGAWREKNVGFIVLQYKSGGDVVVEGRKYDATASMTSRAIIPSGRLPEYGVRGYLQMAEDGLVVGLLSDGRLIEFDESGGRILDPPQGLKPVGVHKWEDKLWLVGLQSDRPALAPITESGEPGAVEPWTASAEAASALQGPQEVIDDRALPSRRVTWPDVRSAIGDYPFLSPFSPTPHAEGTTLWAVAGPRYDVGGIQETSFAVAPFGIRYP
jgi:hypothetical protein